MVEVTANTQGDAVSRMLQLTAKQLKITNMRWTGKGPDDIHMLLVELDNARTLREAMFKGVSDLMSLKETNDLPEWLQAKLAMMVLNARAELDLRIAAREPPKVPA